MDTVRAATDISARHRMMPVLRDLRGRFPGFRGQRSVPLDHYRTNVYSTMGDTPKAGRNPEKYWPARASRGAGAPGSRPVPGARSAPGQPAARYRTGLDG